jgi:hypothetical protein
MNGKPLRLTAAVEWLKGTRFKCLIVMTLLCLGLRENYPFSNFPMYSSFASHTYLIYLADTQGNAISTLRFDLRTSTVKKIFDRWRRAELKKKPASDKTRATLAEQAAAEAVLRYLDRHASLHPRFRSLLNGLRVQYVNIRLEADDLVLETKTLATHE